MQRTANRQLFSSGCSALPVGKPVPLSKFTASATGSQPTTSKERVCVIGAGCAGMSAAWSMSRYPDKYQVEVWESSDRIGGHADTLTLPGGAVMNEAVHGGTYTAFPNTLALIKAIGWKTIFEDKFHVIFSLLASAPEGGCEPPQAWGTRVPSSPLYTKHARDIKRFTGALKWLWQTKMVLLLLLTPLRLLCRVLGCSDSFWEEMVAPLGVIFFGTGNRMAACPAIILAGSFFQMDQGGGGPSIEVDDKTLTAPKPLPFFQLPRADCLYQVLQSKTLSNGNVTIKTNHPATSVYPNKPSHFHTGSSSMGSRSSSSSTGGVVVVDSQGEEHHFDAVVFACHAPAALKLLPNPSWVERQVLGGVEYHQQSTIVHLDRDYISRYHPALLEDDAPTWSVQHLPQQRGYELVYQLSMPLLKERSEVAAAEAAAACGTAEGPQAHQSVAGLGPLDTGAACASSSDPSRPGEASKSRIRTSHSSSSSGAEGSRTIWQLALPGKGSLSELSRDKIISIKTYEHPAHTVAHFLRTILLMRRLQGKNHMFFAGGWTFVDAHEYAIISGLAAAQKLGCDYPFGDNPKAAETYGAYMNIAHGI